jgi:hypothetical protein
MKKILLKKLVSLAMIVFAILPCFALAQGTNLYINELGDSIGLGTQDIRLTIASILNVALGLLGIIAIVIIIYSGFVWMTAGGNDDKIKQAKKMLTNGLVGLIVIITSYAIARFVLNALIAATSA